jgi:hypothetical protein
LFFGGCLLAYRLIGLIADIAGTRGKDIALMVLWVEGCDSIDPSLLGFAALNANLRFVPLMRKDFDEIHAISEVLNFEPF